ncbi:MAG: SRPBCC family protein [Actinomycetes bacterium]
MSSESFPIQIDADVSTVWPWVVDLTKHATWSPSPYEVELVSGSTGEIGAHYRSVGQVPGDRHHANEVEVTAVEVNRRLSFVARDEMGEFQNTFDLSEKDGGTQVVFSMESPTMTGFKAVLFPIFFPLVVKPNVRKRMRMLKTAVEANPSS